MAKTKAKATTEQYEVRIYQSNIYSIIVTAESAEQAEEIALNGDLDSEDYALEDSDTTVEWVTLINEGEVA